MFGYRFLRVITAAALMISISICSGCSIASADPFSDANQNTYDSEASGQQTENIQEGNEKTGFAEGYSHVDFSELEPSSFLASERDGSLLGQPGYCYGTLSEQEQVVYEEIFSVLTGLQNNCKLSTTDSELVKSVYHNVIADHPEIFWAEGYRLNTTSRGDKVISLEFSMKEGMNREEIDGWQKVIAAYLQKFLEESEEAGIADDSEDYDVIRFTFDYIVKNTEYQESAENNQNICSVFGSGYSVCQGYSVAMQYLLLYQGVRSVTVSGVTKETQTSHAWNLVYGDGSWYYLDVTWGDPSYSESDGISSDMVNYAYFCVTDEEISKTHAAGGELVLPRCTDTKDNYFVRENCFFESWDEERFEDLLSERMQEGETCMSIRMQNQELYQQVKHLLISRQTIFEYLENAASRAGINSSSKISYFENEDFCIITFLFL